MPESNDRGAMTEAVFYILLSLYEPLHGYGIMQNIKKFSNNRVSLGAGTLYGALNTLLKKTWIEAIASKDKTRKKEYCITDLGKEMMNDELVRLKELVINGEKIISEVAK